MALIDLFCMAIACCFADLKTIEDISIPSINQHYQFLDNNFRKASLDSNISY